ncbi:hypothetical protein [Paraburkholderia strydomiana]|uniref:hypothetical protein n=1 Tax=Paraburkholderia strydomiana TaxID=1245417 RepID=UPI001BE96503|nr:hypothetical protein [Paraburkholderia strydomiana]MBT2794832.1 hypothetical protein [Paraburkholderia strydomiana]
MRTTLVAQGKPTDAVLVRVRAEQTGSDRELAGYAAHPPSNEVERKLSAALRATREQLTKQAPNTFFSDYRSAELALEDYQADQQKARFALTALIVLPIDRAIHHFERIAASDLTSAIDRLRANGIGRLMARRSGECRRGLTEPDGVRAIDCRRMTAADRSEHYPHQLSYAPPDSLPAGRLSRASDGRHDPVRRGASTRHSVCLNAPRHGRRTYSGQRQRVRGETARQFSGGTGTSFTVHYMRLDAADGERCQVTKGRYLGQPLHTTKRFSGKREFQDMPYFKTDGRCQITGTSKRNSS